MGTETGNAKKFRMGETTSRSYPTIGKQTTGRDYTTMPGSKSATSGNNGGGSDSRNTGRSHARTYAGKFGSI